MNSKRTRVLLGILMFVLVFGMAKSSYGSNSSNREVDYLNEQIQAKKEEIEEMKEQREKYSQKIDRLQNQKASLRNQLDLLENRLAKTELEIRDTENQINKVNLEIRKADFEIREKKKKIQKEKDHIAKIINLIYKQNQADTLEILLLNESFAEFINKLKYLQDINEEIEIGVKELKQDRKDLKVKKENLEEKNKKLARLKKELQNKKEELEENQESKKFLLQKTDSSEDRYQQLLRQAEEERQQTSREIASLEKKVREKLKDKPKEELSLNDNGFIWPVPNHYVTVNFHDPDYPFRYLFEHPAIDIRASQGTPIKAAASGYVAKVKYNSGSSKYAYIMVIHGDGMATLYGHISKPLVSEEDYVVQGQNIALSGGMPGTSGAGYLTTGPHLHFELRKDGIPIDPLPNLP